MTTFDYAVLVIIGLSTLLSIMRGLVREVLAILGWVAAVVVAKMYTLQLAPLLPDAIPSEALRVMAAFIILFLATILISSLLAIVLSEAFKQIGLGWIDRFFGAAFGLLRGLVIVTVLVFLGGFTSFPQDISWRNAMFSAPLEALVGYAMPWVPKDIAKHIKYD